MKTYLKSFKIASDNYEDSFLGRQRMTCFNSYYPFRIFYQKRLPKFEFSPITIFYGGNGSGKSTLLNIIAEKLRIERHTPFNTTKFMDDYVHGCKAEISASGIPDESLIIASDDIFNYLIDLRYMNNGIDAKREDMMKDYYEKRKPMQLHSMDDYENYKKHVQAVRNTASKFIKNNLINNIKMASNGESAIKFFTTQINENALYLLDEPENSMAPKMQLMLKDYIESSVKGYDCQFIIATHSPFLLALEGSKIYDLDDINNTEKTWTEVENTKIYYEFFKSHSDEFEK